MSNSLNKTLGIIFLTAFIDLLGVGIVIPIIAPLFITAEVSILPIEFSYEVRTRLMGILIALYAFGLFLGAPLIGRLSDKYGRKKILFYTLFLTLASQLLFGLSIMQKWPVMLFVARLISGIAGGNLSVVLSSIADVSTPETRTKNFGLVGVAFGIGFVIGPSLGGVLSDSELLPWFKLYTPFIFTTLLAIINIFLVARYFPDLKISNAGKVTISLWGGFVNLANAFNNRKLRVLFLVSFLLTFGFSLFSQFFSVLLIKKLAFTQSDLGMLFGFIGIWLVFTQGGLLRIVGKYLNGKIIVQMFLPILAFSFYVISLPNTYTEMYLSVIPIAVSQGLISPNITGMVSNSVADNVQGKVLGMQQSVQSFAQIIPPLIGGFLVSLKLEYPLYLAAGSVGLSWLVFVVLKKAIST